MCLVEELLMGASINGAKIKEDQTEDFIQIRTLFLK